MEGAVTSFLNLQDLLIHNKWQFTFHCLYQVKIQFAASVSLVALKKFLMGQQNGKAAQDAVQGLDIVLRQIPSYQFTPVGRSFFPFDSRCAKPLGEGCEVQFGFYQSVRHSEWKAMLVNIDGKRLLFFVCCAFQ